MASLASCVATIMDDDDQEEFRCGSDVEIEEYTDTEDSPYADYQSDKLFNTDSACWKKFSFLFTITTVVISVTTLIISFPLYLESVGTISTAYTGLLFIAISSVGVISLISFFVEKISPPPALMPNSMKIRIPRSSLLKISLIYAVSGILIVMSMDQNRVLCHLQDPIKGIMLVFSLVYYFFFCQKMMSLQRIFSSTTIIVGLFISVDFGLCDGFRCRGRDVSPHADSSKSSWESRAAWTFVYIGALATLSMFFTLLERHFTCGQQSICHMISGQTSFLHTISRLVSTRDVRQRSGGSEEEDGRLLHTVEQNPTIKSKSYPKPPIIKSLLHIHLCTLFIILGLVWIDTLPGIGRGVPPEELYQTMKKGLLCHFKPTNSCMSTPSHGWVFVLSYVTYSVSTLHFLSMCESAVFTVAATSASLPLTGIWWSVYRMNVGNGGSISWAPEVTGELVCALLGLPVVLLGLGLLTRSHFREVEPSYESVQSSDPQQEQTRS